LGLTRIGAVSYLNARPLTWGLERGLGSGRIELRFGPPAALADEMAAGRLDLGLLPVAALAGPQQLELVPGLAVGTFGPSRSVLLLCRRPPAQIDSVALDPASRTSNALCQVLLARAFGRRPTFVRAPAGDDPLSGCDAAVRIGDRALFEPLPEGCTALDLAQVWTAQTRRPFVFAAWIARPGVVDPELYRLLHASSRQGRSEIERIALDAPQPDLARDYLLRNIRTRLGAPEIEALLEFFRAAVDLGCLERVPEIRLAGKRRTTCDAVAEALRP
jgi:chorismate dehydratase